MNHSPHTPADTDARRGLSERLINAACAAPLAEWDESRQATADTWIAAYELTVVMGHCQLFGFTPADSSLVSPLYASMVEAALRGSFRQARWTLRHLQSLEGELEESESAIEDHELAIRVLQGRFDLQASRLACQMSLDTYRKAGIPVEPVLDALISTQLGVLDQVDALITEHRGALSLADETFWVANLRDDLAPDAWQPRPWWLSDEIADIRRFHKRLIHAMEDADQQAVRRLTFVPRLVDKPALVETPISIAAELTLAADAQAERDPVELLRFKFVDSRQGDHRGEQITVCFQLRQGQRLENLQALPAEAVVAISLESILPLNEVEIDAAGFAVRTYIIRWGVSAYRVQVRRRVLPESEQVALNGTVETTWGKVKPLFDANEKRLSVRRLQ
ncbi:MAG TPA: hypothetical protein DDZ51_22055 [Planctomycetaceae bacterium]|nr:hypothetical protein [Planctomycetaceae bacterium]